MARGPERDSRSALIVVVHVFSRPPVRLWFGQKWVPEQLTIGTFQSLRYKQQAFASKERLNPSTSAHHVGGGGVLMR